MVAKMMRKIEGDKYKAFISNIAYVCYVLIIANLIWGKPGSNGFFSGVFAVFLFLIFSKDKPKEIINTWLERLLSADSKVVNMLTVLSICLFFTVLFAGPYLEMSFTWVEYTPAKTKEMIFSISWILLYLVVLLRQIYINIKSRTFYLFSVAFFSTTLLLWASPGWKTPFLFKLQGDMQAAGFISGMLGWLVFLLVLAKQQRSVAKKNEL